MDGLAGILHFPANRITEEKPTNNQPPPQLQKQKQKHIQQPNNQPNNQTTNHNNCNNQPTLPSFAGVKSSSSTLAFETFCVLFVVSARLFR